MPKVALEILKLREDLRDRHENPMYQKIDFSSQRQLPYREEMARNYPFGIVAGSKDNDPMTWPPACM